MVLVLCSSLDNAKYFYQTVSIVKFAKGHNSVQNVGGVMVLVLCTSFDDALYWFKVS